jgi:hypothetical protein
MKTILLDSNIYKITDSDFSDLESAELACYGSCNDYTLGELRKECQRIKKKYEPVLGIELSVDTPPSSTNLPF